MVTAVLLAVAMCAPCQGRGQTSVSSDSSGDALALYRQLLNPALNPAEIHRIREVSIDREDLHIVLTDGVIGFIQPVNGHITGGFFTGEGHILMFAPNRAERASLGLFTGSGVLDEQFSAAYLRFFDDRLVEELRAGFRPAEETEEFMAKWSQPVTALARADSLPLLQSMTGLPPPEAVFIHLRLAGARLGIFDAFLNMHAPEQVSMAQPAQANGTTFYNSWVSFPARSVREAVDKASAAIVSDFETSDYRIRAKLSPPSDLTADAELTLTPRHSGPRTVIFELSRYLKISEVLVNGQQAEFIQNEAIDGSDLARQGNDLTAVILPSPAQAGVPLKLAFRYSGPVMSEAGDDLIYVGARGSWYPGHGPAFARFDISFEYPAGWTVVATGKLMARSAGQGEQTARFVSSKPIFAAGFNLGKFETSEATAGEVKVHVYGARSIETPLAQKEIQAGLHPDPAKQVQRIAGQAATSVRFLSGELDPFPYSTLEVSQLPALLSQAWPGMIYLSSLAYLDPQGRQALGIHDRFLELLLDRLMLAHETAHQWWGDAVNSASYRDEWMIEALANYSALLMLEREKPGDMRVALDHYRDELLKSTSNGIVGDAGAVTLGRRLTSSKFPSAFDPVLYGRGTWLVHMLRTMLRQSGDGKSDALFFAALKDLLARSENYKISTHDLQRAVERVMPPSLKYEGKQSLDWFFDSWVDGSAIPQFTLENLRITPAHGGVKVTGAIHESFAAKDMVTAVPVYAMAKDGSSHFLSFVFVDEEKTDFTVTAPAGTKELVLDPENTLLRR